MSNLVSILPWVQIAVSVLLVTVVLIQQNESSLGSAFGGAGSSGVNYRRRGGEKVLFISTIVLAIAFLITSLIALLV